MTHPAEPGRPCRPFSSPHPPEVQGLWDSISPHHSHKNTCRWFLWNSVVWGHGAPAALPAAPPRPYACVRAKVCFCKSGSPAPFGSIGHFCLWAWNLLGGESQGPCFSVEFLSTDLQAVESLRRRSGRTMCGGRPRPSRHLISGRWGLRAAVLEAAWAPLSPRSMSAAVNWTLPAEFSLCARVPAHLAVALLSGPSGSSVGA